MKTVKDLIANLQRFNPEARISPQVEIHSHSPTTDCFVEVSGALKQGTEELPLGDDVKSKIEDLCKELDPGVTADENSVFAKLRKIIA